LLLSPLATVKPELELAVREYMISGLAPKDEGVDGLVRGEDLSTGRAGQAMSGEVIAGAVEPLVGGGDETAAMVGRGRPWRRRWDAWS